MSMTSDCYATAFLKNYSRTVRYLSGKGLPVDQAEEAAQAAWVRGWEQRDQLRDPGCIAQWIARIALNFYRNGLRRTAREATLSELLVAPPNTFAALELGCLLAKCADKDRALLEEYCKAGADLESLADQYRCSRTALRIRLCRAKRSVADATAPCIIPVAA